MPNRAALWRAQVNAEAGSERTVLERVRSGLTVLMPDGQQRVMRFRLPIHRMDGAEIDTDLDDGSGSWNSRGKTIDFGLLIGTAGRFQITPRPAFAQEYLDVARPQWNTGSWQNIPYLSASRSGDTYGAIGTGISMAIRCDPSGVTVTIICDSAATVYPMRFPITVRKLTYLNGVFSGQDAVPVLRLADRWETGPVDGWHDECSPIPRPAGWLPEPERLLLPPQADTSGEHCSLSWLWNGTQLYLTPTIVAGVEWPVTFRFGVAVI